MRCKALGERKNYLDKNVVKITKFAQIPHRQSTSPPPAPKNFLRTSDLATSKPHSRPHLYPSPHRTFLWRLWRNICGDFAVLHKVTISLYMHYAQCVTISILMLHLLRRMYTCMQYNKINHKFKISILLSNNSVKMENDKRYQPDY